MLTYLMKKQMHKKDDGMIKPMMITGAVITGVGAYAVYKMVKSHKSNSQMVNTNYYGNSDYDDYEYEELKKKVKEFNSRRINCENCPHVSQEEMMQYVNSVKDVKEELDLHEDAKKDNIYKEDEYKKYEEE